MIKTSREYFYISLVFGFIFILFIASISNSGFDSLEMKLYGDYITFEQFKYRLIRLNTLFFLLTFLGVSIVTKLIFFQSVKAKIFALVTLIMLFVINGIPFFRHITENRDSELSVYYLLEQSFGYWAHGFYVLPFLSFIIITLVLWFKQMYLHRQANPRHP